MNVKNVRLIKKELYKDVEATNLDSFGLKNNSLT